MNLEKTGKLIRELRKEKNMTQEVLANKLNIGREAVSKWENGKCLPDISIFPQLSKELGISVNELIYGERETENNKKEIETVSLNIYNENKKIKKALIIISLLCIILILSFLIYYFVSTYNSIHVYTFNYSDNQINITDGILVQTSDRIFFDLGTVTSDDKVERLKLYYIDEHQNEVLIQEVDDNKISFNDYKGYNAYVDFENLTYIFSNMYLEIQFEDDQSVIPIHLSKTFSNNHLVPESQENIVTKYFKEIENLSNVQESIQEIFDFDGANYTYQINDLNYLYLPDAEILYVKSEDMLKEWYYNLESKELKYTLYDKDYNVLMSYSLLNNHLVCDKGNCQDYLNETNIFFENFKDIIT